MTTFYCSTCWHESDVFSPSCPNCGNLNTYCSEETYAGTLMNCLNHPVRDYRLIAVQVLGKIRYAPAEPHLVSIVHSEQDKEMIQAATESIQKIHRYKIPKEKLQPTSHLHFRKTY